MDPRDNNGILHPCFCISEILFSILNVLPKPSLPAVARTCQTLREPALDVLYYEMDTLIDVFLCLSDDLLLISPGGWVDSVSYRLDINHRVADLILLQEKTHVPARHAPI